MGQGGGDVGRGEGGGKRKLHLTLHCHHLNDSAAMRAFLMFHLINCEG